MILTAVLSLGYWGCAMQVRHHQITSSSAMAERPREPGNFEKARVNGGTDNHSLKGFSQVLSLIHI